MKFKFLPKENIENLPKNPGVYCFGSKKEILYIGKAANLKERVKNHFQNPSWRDNLFLKKIEKIGFVKTSSEIEALILESSFIKKYQPKYNILWRDDKNYFYVAISKEKFPRLFLTHQKKEPEKNEYLGPFVEGKAIKKALRFLRKIFPYYTIKKHPKKPCLWCHLGLCPGLNIDEKEYRKNIKNLVAVLKGRKNSVLKNFKKEMKKEVKLENFEKAAKIRDQILALEKVISNFKILWKKEKFFENRKNWEDIERELKKILNIKKGIFRIEAYDISNIQGKSATGSMITFFEGTPLKNLYRRFKIKTVEKPNDTAMIKEVLRRRFSHPEWGFPDLILIDGGKSQLSAGLKIKKENPQLKNIKMISLAKKENKLFVEGQKKIILLKNFPREIFNLILQLRDEAHRFALFYHRKLREKNIF